MKYIDAVKLLKNNNDNRTINYVLNSMMKKAVEIEKNKQSKLFVVSKSFNASFKIGDQVIVCDLLKGKIIEVINKTLVNIEFDDGTTEREFTQFVKHQKAL